MMLTEPGLSDNLPASIRAILARQGKRRSFLRDAPVRNVTRHGLPGLEFAVNLTSYRSLPLSCIEGLLLKIDGKEMDVSDAGLLLNSQEYRFQDLGPLTGVWWFILDPGAIFVPQVGKLSAGLHAFEATLITVEPYITAGRFSFYHGDRRELMVEAEGAQ